MAEFSVMINLGKADLDDYSLLAKMLHKTGFSETKAAQVAADLTFRTSRTQFGANFVASPAGERRLPGHRVA